ncbi:Hypothetical protein A7982_01922 [Minicystis rosea]|nr:Hypothetical protein A7982_01922 [Minicystis rosea]
MTRRRAVRASARIACIASAVYLVGLAASCGSPGSTSSTSSGGAGGGGGAVAPTCSEPSGKTFTQDDVSHADPFASKGEYASSLAVAPNGAVAIIMQGHPAPLPTRVGVRLSPDEGETWGPVLLPDVPEGFASSDPRVAVDADGNFSVVYRGVDLSNPSGQPIFAARVGAGATTLEAAVQIAGPGVDQDQATSPAIAALADGSTLVTYTGANLGSLHAAVSKDAGKTWTTSVIVEGGGLYDMATPCQSTGGSRVYIAHLGGSTAAPIAITLRHSDDGGSTWLADGSVSVTDAAAGAVAFAPPSCIVDGDDVWVSYGVTRDPVDFTFLTVQPITAIQVARSSDGGKTFDVRHDAHDVAAGAVFLASSLVREEGGALDLTYIAGKGAGDTAATVRRSRSTDGGKTWCGSVVVHAPITFEPSLTHENSLSRRHGLAYRDGALYVSYPDNATEFSHVGFQRIGIP